MGPTRRRSRRTLWLVFMVAGVVLALVVARIAAPLWLAWRHYSTTPDFATYLREHPVGEPLPVELWPEAEVLSTSGAWSIGDVDPNAVAEDDPEHERLVVRFQAALHHGEELLLDLEQEVAVVADRESGDRRGLAVRTTRCVTGAGMRALARVYLDDPEQLVGPQSEGQGLVSFDALVVAGAGEDRLEITRRPEAGPPSFEPTRVRLPWGQYVTGLLHPTDPLLPEGLIHRFRRDVGLTWSRIDGGRQGAAAYTPYHAVNTGQYSYKVEFLLETQGTGATVEYTDSSSQTYTWNGVVW